MTAFLSGRLLLLVLLAYIGFYVYGASSYHQDTFTRVVVTFAVAVASVVIATMWLFIFLLIDLIIQHGTAGLVPIGIMPLSAFGVLALVLVFTYRKVIRIGRKHASGSGALGLAFFWPIMILAILFFLIGYTPLDIG